MFLKIGRIRGNPRNQKSVKRTPMLILLGQKKKTTVSVYDYLVGGFKYFTFSPLFGEDFQFDEHIFQMGWFNHQPVILESKK